MDKRVLILLSALCLSFSSFACEDPPELGQAIEDVEEDLELGDDSEEPKPRKKAKESKAAKEAIQSANDAMEEMKSLGLFDRP